MDAERSRLRLEAEARRLQEVRAGLERDHPYDSDVERGSELSSLDQHQADVASDLLEHEVELSILGAVDAGINEVHDALRRLDSNVYGRCQACGAPISDDRLDAMPATRFCLGHEQLREGPGITQPLPAGRYTDGAASADSIAAREATEHLEFLPTDDEMAEDLSLGPEERALHRIGEENDPFVALTPQDVEAAEPLADCR